MEKSMKSYTCQIFINAPAATVYKALATIEGLQKWWTPFCMGGEKEGDELSFYFDIGHNTMRIEKLIPNQEVRWKCIAQNFPDLMPKPDEWVGTSLLFHLTPDKKGTNLEFVHEGLTPAMHCFDLCRNGWDHFLKESLKSLVETGTGKPYTSTKSLYPIGGLSWFEIPVSDIEKAKQFYSALFGWNYEKFMYEASYCAIQGENGRMGALRQTNELASSKPVSHPLPVMYFTVDDVGGTLKKVQSLGGQIALDKCDIPNNGGSYAHFHDLDKNRIGIYALPKA